MTTTYPPRPGVTAPRVDERLVPAADPILDTEFTGNAVESTGHRIVVHRATGDLTLARPGSNARRVKPLWAIEVAQAAVQLQSSLHDGDGRTVLPVGLLQAHVPRAFAGAIEEL